MSHLQLQVIFVGMDDIDALSKGCIVSFKLIYFQYHEKLYSFIFSKTASSYLAEEVVQLAFIRLWENRGILPAEVPLNVQLFRMARTILIDLLRKNAVRDNHLNSIAESIPQFTEDHVLPEKDLLKHVYEAMDQLPPMRKTIFKLSRLNGLTHKEIAEMFSISPKTVENHINIAIRQLKKGVGFGIILHILNNY